eukprot:m.260927 g.260927  ORF g.260927 m.260927 type:complete len:502 (+) comp19682_c0_seq2:222-1727(+)
MHACIVSSRILSHVCSQRTLSRTYKNVSAPSAFLYVKHGLPCTPRKKSHPYGTGVARDKHISGDDLLDTLRKRGLVADCTDDELGHIIKNNEQTVYCGFDPTAPTLHVGNLVTVMTLIRFALYGHNIIFLVGGATGRIGDPSGRSVERTMMDSPSLNSNLDGIRSTIHRICDNAFAQYKLADGQRPIGNVHVVDNYSWYNNFSIINFLSEIGPHFRVQSMLSKHSVKSRLEQSESGLTFLEFSYQVLQAYDFLYLRDTYGCHIQLGGADQWGNITAGCDLIRKARKGASVYGLTVPLVTTSTGVKFGKSAGNAVWLEESMTSPYHLYQFLLNTADADVERLLNLLTLLDTATVDATMRAHSDQTAHLRGPQRLLAATVTTLIHGAEAASNAEAASQALFGGTDLRGISAAHLRDMFRDAPTVTLSKSDATGTTPLSLVDLATATGLFTSKKDARRTLASGGLYVNNVKAEHVHFNADVDVLHDTVTILRKGKRNYVVVQWT